MQRSIFVSLPSSSSASSETQMIHDSMAGQAAHASILFHLSLLMSKCKCFAVQNKPDAVFIGLPPEFHGSIDDSSANIEIKLAEVARPPIVRHTSFTFPYMQGHLHAAAKQHVHWPAYRHTCWHDGAHALAIKDRPLPANLSIRLVDGRRVCICLWRSR